MNFNNYFIRKFNGRVGLIDIKLQNNNTPTNIPIPQVEAKKIEQNEQKEL